MKFVILEKSDVKGHTRILPSGKVIFVTHHTRGGQPHYPEDWKNLPVEYVSTDELWKYREFDRDPTDNRFQTTHSSIANEGIKEPLILQYYKDGRVAVLGEGNHRLLSAKTHGIPHVPVRAIRYDSSRDKYYSPKLGRKFGKVVPGFEPNKHGYVPGDLYPSDIGIPVLETKSWRKLEKSIGEGSRGGTIDTGDFDDTPEGEAKHFRDAHARKYGYDTKKWRRW